MTDGPPVQKRHSDLSGRMSAPGKNGKRFHLHFENVASFFKQYYICHFFSRSRSWASCNNTDQLWAKNIFSFNCSSWWNSKWGSFYFFGWNDILYGIFVLLPYICHIVPYLCVNFYLSLTPSLYCWGAISYQSKILPKSLKSPTFLLPLVKQLQWVPRGWEWCLSPAFDVKDVKSMVCFMI